MVLCPQNVAPASRSQLLPRSAFLRLLIVQTKSFITSVHRLGFMSFCCSRWNGTGWKYFSQFFVAKLAQRRRRDKNRNEQYGFLRYFALYFIHLWASTLSRLNKAKRRMVFSSHSGSQKGQRKFVNLLCFEFGKEKSGLHLLWVRGRLCIQFLKYSVLFGAYQGEGHYKSCRRGRRDCFGGNEQWPDLFFTSSSQTWKKKRRLKRMNQNKLHHIKKAALKPYLYGLRATFVLFWSFSFHFLRFIQVDIHGRDIIAFPFIFLDGYILPVK